MNRIQRILNALFVTVALAAPVSLAIASSPQQEGNQQRGYRGRNVQDRNDRTPVRSYRDNRGYRHFYDPDNRQWHAWNYQENNSYHRWLGEKHQDYRDFSRLPGDQQREYFQWRKGHPGGERNPQ